jgi:hypothetical protein
MNLGLMYTSIFAKTFTVPRVQTLNTCLKGNLPPTEKVKSLAVTSQKEFTVVIPISHGHND